MLKNLFVIRTSTPFKLLVTALISYVLYLLAPFLLPILLAIALSFALFPLVNLTSKLTVGHGAYQISRVLAIVLVLCGFIGFVCLLIVVIVLPLFGQINHLIQHLPDLHDAGSINNVGAWLSNKANIPKLPSNYEMLVEDILSWAMNNFGDMLKNLLNSSLQILAGLIGLVVVPFLSYYFLKDWRELCDILVDLFKYKDQPRVRIMLQEIGSCVSAYVNGLGKLSLISAFCVTTCLYLLGVPYAMVFGFVALLTELIPMVGPLFGAVPAIFVAYGQDPTMALKVGAFYMIYYQLDSHLIMPKLMGKKINLHPVVIIISLLIGAELFGILGMLFAVPVAAVYKVLYQELWHLGEDDEDQAV